MEAKEILELVRERMEREGLSQRQAADYLGITQGHLSKLLNSQAPVTKKFVAAARAWVTGQPARPCAVNDGEEALLEAARRAAGGSERVMHLMAAMMHQVDQARRVRRRGPVGDRRASGDADHE